MSKILWDQLEDRKYETGVDHGVLYKQDDAGAYDIGVAWNGLVSVTESPEGAEATAQYADNMKYLNLISAEDYKATVEAFTYPDEFEECNGVASPVPGVHVGQQNRRGFGLVWRTKVGNAVNPDLGYKIHIVWGATAAPSEKAYETVNDSPEAMTLSWELSTTPVAIDLEGFRPTASITIDSTTVDPIALAALETELFGSAGTDPHLPSPTEVVGFFSAGTLTGVSPVAPTQDEDDITIPTVTGVVYKIAGETVTGVVTITDNTIVKAVPASGYYFTTPFVDDWLFTV